MALCLSRLTLAASGVLGPLARAWGCPLSEAKLRLPGRLCSGREASGSFQPPANALEPSYNFIHSFICLFTLDLCSDVPPGLFPGLSPR